MLSQILKDIARDYRIPQDILERIWQQITKALNKKRIADQGGEKIWRDG